MLKTRAQRINSGSFLPHHGARHGAASRITRVDGHVGRAHNAQRSKHMSRWKDCETTDRINRESSLSAFNRKKLQCTQGRAQCGRSCTEYKTCTHEGMCCNQPGRGQARHDMLLRVKLRGEVSSSGSFDSISFNCHRIQYFERVPPHWLKRMLHDHPVVNDFRLAKHIDRLKKSYANPAAFETLAWQTRIKPMVHL